MQPNISNQVPFSPRQVFQQIPSISCHVFFPAITLWEQLFRHSYFRHNFLKYFLLWLIPEKSRRKTRLFLIRLLRHDVSNTTFLAQLHVERLFLLFFPFFQFPWQRGDLRSRSPLINRSFSLSGFRVEAILLWTLKMRCTSTINMGFLTLSNEPTFTDSAILLWLIPE